MSSVADETTSGRTHEKAPDKAEETTSAKMAPGNADETGGNPANAAKADKADKADRAPRRRRVSAKEIAHGAKVGSDAVRNRVASIVWIVAVVCAVIVALGAILVVLGKGVETSNPVVQFLTNWADKLSGPMGEMFRYTKDNGKPDVVQNTVLGYGIAAVAWLVGGKVVTRVIGP